MNTTEQPLDQQLLSALHAARGGDRHAFGNLVSLTQGMVTAVALAITSDPAGSEDIAQETYLEAWRRLPTLDTALSPAPWLREVARNKAIDVLRRRRLQQPGIASEQAAELVAPEHGPAEALEQTQRQHIAWSALQSLGEEAREAVLLYYREEGRSDRVASLLGIKESALRKRLQRARDQMRVDVEQQLRCYASETAPGIGFGATVLAAIGTATQPTLAAGTAVAAQSVAKGGLAKLMTLLGSLFAAVGVVVLAVVIDTRIHLKRARSPLQRRRLWIHGGVYALLMAGYIIALSWAARADIGAGWIFALAITVSLLVFPLTFWRQRILRRGDAP